MRLPVLTLVTLSVTATFSFADYLHPSLLGLLQRDPVALSHHQWWRLLTPLLIQPDPWPRTLSVFLLFLIVGSLSERIWKRSSWISLYLLGGLTGEIAGYFWEPYSAGMSVAGAGLLGSLAAWMMQQAYPWQARLGSGFILLGAVVLTAIADIHGPPILIGALMETIMVRRWNNLCLNPGIDPRPQRRTS